MSLTFCNYYLFQIIYGGPKMADSKINLFFYTESRPVFSDRWRSFLAENHSVFRHYGSGSEADLSDSLPKEPFILVTDSPELSAKVSSEYPQAFLLGYEKEPGEQFFPGTRLVFTDFKDTSPDILIRAFNRKQGRKFYFLQTERLKMRELVFKDIFLLISDLWQETFKQASLDLSFYPENLLSYIKHHYEYYDYGLLMVELRDGTPIGLCGLGEFENSDQEICNELEYMLLPSYRHRGYAREMCRAVISYALKEEGIPKLYARIPSDNLPSLRLARDLGLMVIIS